MLLAFATVLMPWPLLHNSLSNHTTEAHTYCATHHKNLAAHVEESHLDCKVFDAKTLLYDKAVFTADIHVLLQLQAVCNTTIKASVSKAVAVNLPSRAPPVM